MYIHIYIYIYTCSHDFQDALPWICSPDCGARLVCDSLATWGEVSLESLRYSFPGNMAEITSADVTKSFDYEDAFGLAVAAPPAAAAIKEIPYRGKSIIHGNPL